MKRKRRTDAFRIIIGAALLGTQFGYAQSQLPTFEVASIRPNHSGSGNSSTNVSKGRLIIENQSLKQLIERAYDVRNFSFFGPGWLEEEHFDIEAKPPVGVTPTEMLLMLQRLLTERFKIAVHHEKRTRAGYLLVVAKGGNKLEAGDTGPSSTSTGAGRVDAKNTSMGRFADMLARQLDQPVQDMTGLEGNYNLKLEWTPDAPNSTGTDAPSRPSLFTALKEQLGLQLRPQKITIQVLVLDHAERVPTEN
jgi:uncharacterized protein (TIGR03435 family)